MSSCQMLEDSIERVLSLRRHVIQSRQQFRLPHKRHDRSQPKERPTSDTHAKNKSDEFALTSQHDFCLELREWCEGIEDSSEDIHKRTAYADYLNDTYLARRLDAFPPSPVVSAVRKFLASTLEEFVSSGCSDHLSETIQGCLTQYSLTTKDSSKSAPVRMNTTTLNQAMALDSTAAYMHCDMSPSQPDQIKPVLTAYLAAKEKQQQQLQEYHALTRDIQSVLDQVRAVPER